MKISTKIWSMIAVMGLLASSCSKMNELPIFDDKDACVAFSAGAMSVNENAGTINIPVSLRTLNGFNTSVGIKAVDGTAKAGVNFNLVTTSVNFTPSEPVQNVQVQITNLDGIFTGDLSFSLELENPGSISLAAEKKITVTIMDLDHPLSSILGTYSAIGESYFYGEESWTITLTKDANDVSKVWITNFVSRGSSAGTPIYGIVDDEMIEIHIPVNQVIAVVNGIAIVRLEGYYDLDGEELMPDGSFITIKIAADKKSMTVMETIGSVAYSDIAAGDDNYEYHYNFIFEGIIMVKD